MGPSKYSLHGSVVLRLWPNSTRLQDLVCLRYIFHTKTSHKIPTFHVALPSVPFCMTCLLPRRSLPTSAWKQSRKSSSSLRLDRDSLRSMLQYLLSLIVFMALVFLAIKWRQYQDNRAVRRSKQNGYIRKVKDKCLNNS